MLANVGNVLAECWHGGNINEIKGFLLSLGFGMSEATDLAEITTKTCERELEPAYLEHLCQHLVNILPTFANTCQQMPTGNFMEEIRNWVACSDGVFSTLDLYREMGIQDRRKQKTVSVALNRLVADGVIERHGAKRGQYRTVDSDCPEVDWRSADTGAVDIGIPFEVERYVEIMPGNIICIAGEPNSGKTAFLLNLAQLNSKRSEVHYFSSEMGRSEFRKRILNFEPMHKTSEWPLHFYERSNNFGDVLKRGRGNINIIDFLELHEDFWRVGGLLKEVHDKLDGAIAVVALQKNRGNEYGLGGGRGLEKPRLYLSMSPGVCRMVKAKNWRLSENPNGLEYHFRLHSGCHFSCVRDWHKPQGER